MFPVTEKQIAVEGAFVIMVASVAQDSFKFGKH